MGVQFYHTLQSTSSFRCLCVAQCPYFIITIVIYLQQALSPFPFPMIIYLPPVHLFHASHPSMQCSKTSGRPSTIYFWISNLPPNQIFLDILDFEREKMQRLVLHSGVQQCPWNHLARFCLPVQVVILFTRALVQLVILYARIPLSADSSTPVTSWVSRVFVGVYLSSKPHS